MQLLMLNYACKYNVLLAFKYSDNFFYPEKFLSSAGWQRKKGIANLPQGENIKTYPLSSLLLVLCGQTLTTITTPDLSNLVNFFLFENLQRLKKKKNKCEDIQKPLMRMLFNCLHILVYFVVGGLSSSKHQCSFKPQLRLFIFMGIGKCLPREKSSWLKYICFSFKQKNCLKSYNEIFIEFK